MGYVLGATVHAANEAETTTAPELVSQVFALYATIRIMFADLGYKEPFLKGLKDTFDIKSEVAKKSLDLSRPANAGWWKELLPR